MSIGIELSIDIAKGWKAQRGCPNDPLGCRSACQVVILGFRNSALISAVSGGRVSVAAGRVQCISKRICSVGAMSQSCAVSALVL